MKRKKTSSLKPKKIVVFIDDDVEEQDTSFYRDLDREHKDQSENDHECEYDRPEDNSPELKVKKDTL